MTDYPKLISISPVYGQKREDDFYLVDREAFPGKGTEYRRADLPAPVQVKPGELERIVWSAMVWARENPGPDEVPEYTDRGNSFAEGECRAAVRRILAALDAAPADPRVVALDSFDMLIAEARTEAAKAMRKFPQPNYVISKVAEEAGEVVKAAIHAAEGRETMENLRGEMTQVIAMIYRLWIEGDQVHGLPPVAAALKAAKEAGE